MTKRIRAFFQSSTELIRAHERLEVITDLKADLQQLASSFI